MTLMISTVGASFSMVAYVPRIRGYIPAGGLLGKLLAGWLDSALNPVGAAIVLISGFFVSLFLSTTFSFGWAIGVLKPRVAFISNWSDRWTEWRERAEQERVQRKAEGKKTPKKQLISTAREATKPAPAQEAKVPVSTPVVTVKVDRPTPPPKPIAPVVTSTPERQTHSPSNLPPTSLLLAPIA